ncbi:MAG: hypothetical protein ACTHKV_13925 [Flavipsychrobacter sp.]
MPWFNFRAYVRFIGRDKKKGHFYGNEHQCTYNQCLYGNVEKIVLRKHKGYTDLINFIEQSIRGKYLSAKIYMRSEGSVKFDLLCREYYKGGLTMQQDPLLSPDEATILCYTVRNGRLEISEENPMEIDFKKEMENI